MSDFEKIELKAPEMSTAPIFYADQPAAVAIGPHVSRLTFGVETEGEYPQPVVVLAIPTIALISFVNDLQATFNGTEFQEDIVKGLENSKKIILAGVGAGSRVKRIKNK